MNCLRNLVLKVLFFIVISLMLMIGLIVRKVSWVVGEKFVREIVMKVLVFEYRVMMMVSRFNIVVFIIMLIVKVCI